jgi:hypothetical protein
MVAVRIRAQVRPYGICSGQSGAWAGFILVLRFSQQILIPPTAPHSLLSSSVIRGWYSRPISGRRTKWAQSHPTQRKLKREKDCRGFPISVDSGNRISYEECNNRRFVWTARTVSSCTVRNSVYTYTWRISASFVSGSESSNTIHSGSLRTRFMVEISTQGHCSVINSTNISSVHSMSFSSSRCLSWLQTARI